jgi:nicotinamidase-related amidase
MDSATGIKSALLVMDVQENFMSLVDPEKAEVYLENVNRALSAARAKNIQVIFVVCGFRPGNIDIAPWNKNLSNVSKMGIDLSHGYTVHSSLEKHENEVIVIKKRASAFSGSDLEIVLRSLRMEELVLTGIATSGVVLSTLREAANKDYRITVLSDGCFDFEEDIHDFLMSKVFPKQANVLSVQEWGARLL